MTKQQRRVLALIIGSNIGTAGLMMILTGDLLRRQEKQTLKVLDTTKKNIDIYKKALEKFCLVAPPEQAKAIIDELAFDWTVRDLVP